MFDNEDDDHVDNYENPDQNEVLESSSDDEDLSVDLLESIVMAVTQPTGVTSIPSAVDLGNITKIFLRSESEPENSTEEFDVSEQLAHLEAYDNQDNCSVTEGSQRSDTLLVKYIVTLIIKN